MTNKKEAIFLDGYTTGKILFVFGAVVLGLAIAFLSQLLVPYVKENPIAMFVIFPAISIPLAYMILRHKPKCKVCGGKTKPAPTKSGSEFDNLVCTSCGQMHTIRSTTRTR